MIFIKVFMDDLMQGPLAAPVLQHLTKEDLAKLYFGEFQILDINGATCFLTRTGYGFLSFFLFLCFPFHLFRSLG